MSLCALTLGSLIVFNSSFVHVYRSVFALHHSIFTQFQLLPDVPAVRSPLPLQERSLVVQLEFAIPNPQLCLYNHFELKSEFIQR